MEHLVYIVILNWNGWQDTINCLESIFYNDYTNYKIIVCDNGSSNKSIEKITQWINNNKNKFNLTPQYLYAEDIKQVHNFYSNFILINNKQNLGFAGGCNVGIKYALKDTETEFVWLLNNDTIIDKKALSSMIKKFQSDKNLGICGSSLLYYNDRHIIQALGGLTYNKWLGTNKGICCGEIFDISKINELNVEKNISAIIGASMLLKKEIFEEFGYLSERYFLYFEELDIAMQIKGKYTMGFSKNSIVYHKEGASTGAHYIKNKSLISDFYSLRNRILFTKRYYPKCIYTVYIGLIISIINRIKRKQYKRIQMIIDLILGKEKDINTYK